LASGAKQECDETGERAEPHEDHLPRADCIRTANWPSRDVDAEKEALSGVIGAYECLAYDGDVGGVRVVTIGEVAAGKKWGAHGSGETRRDQPEVVSLTS
jgi:hypothetical protein